MITIILIMIIVIIVIIRVLTFPPADRFVSLPQSGLLKPGLHRFVLIYIIYNIYKGILTFCYGHLNSEQS